MPGLADAPVCVENIEAIAGKAPQERALFHLHNLVLAQGHALLMTSAREPAPWRLDLPDLQSRVQGAQSARLSEPDDLLLTMLLAKLLADHADIPVTRISDGEEITPDHVYVIPPGCFLEIADGCFRLIEHEPEEGVRTPIDRFFTSLAAAVLA